MDEGEYVVDSIVKRKEKKLAVYSANKGRDAGVPAGDGEYGDILSEGEGDLDSDTRGCMGGFGEYAMRMQKLIDIVSKNLVAFIGGFRPGDRAPVSRVPFIELERS